MGGSGREAPHGEDRLPPLPSLCCEGKAKTVNACLCFVQGPCHSVSIKYDNMYCHGFIRVKFFHIGTSFDVLKTCTREMNTLKMTEQTKGSRCLSYLSMRSEKSRTILND